MQRALVVSIHDIAPATRARVEPMLAQLEKCGGPRCSLLVVPNYHRTGPSLGDSSFIAWLRTLEAQGHEIVIHGFYHQRTRREAESARQKILTRVYTADEGEFYDLDYEEALRLISKAQSEFATHDFHPNGFIAPAWLLGPEAERAVVDAGLRYTTTLRVVRDFAAGKEFISQSLVYSVRSDWRCALSLLWNRTLFRHLTKNPLLRLGLHPPDLDHPGVWRQINALIARALRTRRSMTYKAWLDDQSEVSNQQSAIS